jgi:hypothetical protein
MCLYAEFRSEIVYAFQTYDQVDRPISIGLLNVLLHLHTRPINLVVSKGSDWDT